MADGFLVRGGPPAQIQGGPQGNAYRGLKDLFRETFHSNEEYLPVRCLGERHTISFRSDGRFRLWDHELRDTGPDWVSYRLGAPCVCLSMYEYFKANVGRRVRPAVDVPPYNVPAAFMGEPLPPMEILEDLAVAGKRVKEWIMFVRDHARWKRHDRSCAGTRLAFPGLADMELTTERGAARLRWSRFTDNVGHRVWDQCDSYKNMDRWHLHLGKVRTTTDASGVSWKNEWAIRPRSVDHDVHTHLDIYVHQNWWHRVWRRGWGVKHGMFVLEVIDGYPKEYRVVGLDLSRSGTRELVTLRICDRLRNYEILDVEGALRVRIAEHLSYGYSTGPHIPGGPREEDLSGGTR